MISIDAVHVAITAPPRSVVWAGRGFVSGIDRSGSGPDKSDVPAGLSLLDTEENAAATAERMLDRVAR